MAPLFMNDGRRIVFVVIRLANATRPGHAMIFSPDTNYTSKFSR